MTLSDSIVAYQTFEPDEEHYRARWAEDIRDGFADPEDDFETWMYSHWHDADSQYEWEDLVAWIQETVMEMFPSMWADDDWIDRELHVIAKNEHSLVTVSEYCGMVAICLGPNFDRESFWYDDRDVAPLGRTWRKQVAPKFTETFSELTKLGTFSDGTSVYKKNGE